MKWSRTPAVPPMPPAMTPVIVVLVCGVLLAHAEFSIEQLVTYKFPNRTSNDVDLDICKHARLSDSDIVVGSKRQKEELEMLMKMRSDEEKLMKMRRDEEMLMKMRRDEERVNAATTTPESRHHQNRLNRSNNNSRNRNKRYRTHKSARSSFEHDVHHRRRGGAHSSSKSYENEEKKINTPMESMESMSSMSSASSMSSMASRSPRAATARVDRLWDYAIIPYEIEANFSGPHRALFRQAMMHWENFTCVKFVEREPQHEHYIVFTERPCGCCSFVGKRGNGPQAISIGKNCDKFGIVVHELGHVVGFWHEHTRPDRDSHVQIIDRNIMSGQEYNFNKLTEEDVNSLGLPYDFDSIMHYARNTFSRSTQLDTILPREDLGGASGVGGGNGGVGGSTMGQGAGGGGMNRKRPEIGQRVRLSKGDIAQTNKLYNCPKCGRTLQGASGRLSSEEFSGRQYVADDSQHLCEWRITATHGERIQLNITELDIFESENCETDYVEVRDGYWHQSDLIGRYCGTGTLPDTLFSTGYRMTVIYRTSVNARNHSGFEATYEAICGGELQLDEELVLQSPNYPDEYRSSKECVWKISVEEKFQVALKFQAFEVESHDNCVYDYVEIIDGHDNDSPVIGKFCGYKLPEDGRSSDNKLMLKFVSDSTVQKGGFSATLLKEFDECVNTEHGCDHICVNTLGGYRCECKIGYELHSDGKKCEDACGGVMEAVNGTLTSPSFPDLYPPNKNCIWEIVAPPQHRITLNFTHFELEGNNQECEYDSIDVTSRSRDVAVKKHGVFCGSQRPPSVTSEANVLRVEFNSDNSVQKSGFAAVFFTDRDECSENNGGCQHICKNTIGAYECACFNGFVLHPNKHDCKEGSCMQHIQSQQGGDITSPNFPLEYPSKKECAWLFSTTPGHRLKLIFDVFELEPHQECSYDQISVYDGENTDSSSLGVFCGAKLPHPLLSSSNRMYLVFKSDASVSRKGFKAHHSTVCGGRLVARTTVQHLYSHPKYGDVNYENNKECDWLIEAEEETGFARLTFVTFELEGETECLYDVLSIYDGYDDSSAPAATYCGNKVPSEFISTGPALLIRFRSDDNVNAKGFSVAYSSESHTNNVYSGFTRISLKPPVF